MSFDLCGYDIWLLYHDVCKNNLSLVIVLLRSVQLGICSIFDIKNMIQAGFHIDIKNILFRVIHRLPNLKLDMGVDYSRI